MNDKAKQLSINQAPNGDKQFTILIVDDMPENLNILIRYLQNFQYHIKIAMSGEDALKIIDRTEPDLILLDVIMPGMDGFETCKRIKKIPKAANVPVIFLTGLSDTTDKIKGFEVGGVDYLIKPIQHEELLARVNTHLKMRNMQQELLKAEKINALSTLAAGIAHDFNNTLSIISGNIQLLKEECHASSLLASTEKAVVRAADLSKSLLSFTKGSMPVKKEGNLIALIKESAHFILDDSKIIFDLTHNESIWTVEFDYGQIRQVLNHIILNAEQAMPLGGTVQINISNFLLDEHNEKNGFLLNRGKYVCISIQDKGCGIPEDILPKIFDPFFSTHERSNQKGMGLGLASAYAIIQQHGGCITVDSDLGKGSTFKVYLPSFESKEVFENPMTEKGEEKKIVNGKRTGKILIMDDEDEICTLTSLMLKRIHFTSTCVENGKQAIEKYKEALDNGEPFDAVILDLTIKGGMGGVETLKRLYKLDPNITAIITSGYFDDPVLSDYHKYGFSDVLIKPYLIEDLERVLSIVK